MRAKQIYEFTRGGDPFDTLGIGYKAKIHKFFDELDIERNLYIIENNNIIFMKGLKLIGNTNLIKLPDNLKINMYFNVNGCINLVELPNNLKINGYAEMQRCYSLVKLPDNLTIYGSLNLKNSTNLVNLPKNLKVYSYLDIINTNLLEIPDDLFVKGCIYVAPNQTKLIDCISSSKFKNKLKLGNN